jgi:hypothetical protein
MCVSLVSTHGAEDIDFTHRREKPQGCLLAGEILGPHFLICERSLQAAPTNWARGPGYKTGHILHVNTSDCIHSLLLILLKSLHGG